MVSLTAAFHHWLYPELLHAFAFHLAMFTYRWQVANEQLWREKSTKLFFFVLSVVFQSFFFNLSLRLTFTLTFHANVLFLNWKYSRTSTILMAASLALSSVSKVAVVEGFLTLYRPLHKWQHEGVYWTGT